MKEERTTVDDAEIERFTRMADEWWNPNGKFKPLHQINPLRIQWICKQIPGVGCQVSDKKGDASDTCHMLPVTLLDIGCGGGLISEPMAQAGATVTGIDAGEKNIKVAALHAEKSGVKVDYRCTTAEDLAATGAQFDVVVALEIIEHVADVAEFVKASVQLLKPGGKIFYSTLNRTPKSYALAIIGAEYILRWLPIGTHTWKKFLKPSELCGELRKNGIEITEMTGMVMNPLTFQWRLDEHDLSVNYLVAGTKA